MKNIWGNPGYGKSNVNAMKYIWISVVLFCAVISGNLSGQNNYILTDSLISIGIKVLDGGDIYNARFCKVNEKGKVTQYSPYEILEYGLKDGRIYTAKEIVIDDSTLMVFLQKLVKDSTMLYYYRDEKHKTFFIENKRINIVEIPRKIPGKPGFSHKDLLCDLTSDCQNVANAAKLVSYNKNSLATYIERYNTCKKRPFPFFKYGAYSGIGLSWLVPSPDPGSAYFQDQDFRADFKCDYGLTIGIFIDKPINVTDFSFHPEIYFTDYGYSSNSVLDSQEIDIVVNSSAINVPILFRYTVPIMKARPYLNLGGIYSHHLKIEYQTYSTVINQGVIEISLLTKPSPVATDQFGFSTGAGLEVDLTYRFRLYLDFKYNLLYGGTKEEDAFYEKELLINAGISF
jgi:hypothetical protein